MKVAVLSDSHDEMNNLSWALEKARELGAQKIFHLGDMVSPFMYGAVMSKFEEDFDEFVLVFGNNDGDRTQWIRLSQENEKLNMALGDFREFEFEDYKVFLTHYPEIAELAALSGKYRAVFHGHTHIMRKDYVKDCLLANPGEILGRRTGKVSFAIWDSTDNSFIFYEKDEN